jgi:hypothetical protein
MGLQTTVARVAAAALAACALTVSGAAHAEMSGTEYLAQQGDSAAVGKFALAQMENGMAWANADLKNRNVPSLYCVPGSVVIAADQPDTVLRAYLQRHPDLARYPVGAILLKAMEDAYPCAPTPG